jgi:chaperone required for assembly of F1-ATPase
MNEQSKKDKEANLKLSTQVKKLDKFYQKLKNKKYRNCGSQVNMDGKKVKNTSSSPFDAKVSAIAKP